MVDCPVYSLAVAWSGQVNMNICTYVIPVSRKPKFYAVSLEKGSRTLEMFKQAQCGVIQLLNQHQIDLINLLGKRSGHKVDKHKILETRGALLKWNKNVVIKDAAAYLEVEVREWADAGDHEVAICQVTKSSTRSEQNLLTFQQLIDQGVILS